MSNSSLQTVEPVTVVATDDTFISADASKVNTKSAEVVEVWGRMTNFVAGQLDSVELLISPIDIDAEPPASDFVGHGPVTVNIGADGMFFVETLARKNGDELGKLVKAQYISSGATADFTLELFLVLKP